MDLDQIKKSIESLFSKDGLQVSKFKLFFPEETSIRLNKYSESIELKFGYNLPVIKTRKMMIPISLDIESVILNNNGGKIRIKNFPDINFKYDEWKEKIDSAILDENIYGSIDKNDINIYVDLVQKDIRKKYRDKERRRIADLALKYSHQWIKLVNDDVFDTDKYLNTKNKKQLIKDCEIFVKKNIIESKEIEGRSKTLSIVLIYFILPAIINWVVKKFLDYMFD